MGHIHAELMAQYAEDAKKYDKPWELWQYGDGGTWTICASHQSWYNESQYRRTSQVVSDEQIKAVFLANGFTIKEGMTDLKPYVYQAARALLVTGQAQAVEKLREELAKETEAADNWRRLALQFDNHRMQALGHLKAVVNPGAVFDAYKAAKAFLNAPPLDGEEVLAQRIATLAAQAKQKGKA